MPALSLPRSPCRRLAQAACLAALIAAWGVSAGAEIDDPTRGDMVLFPTPFEDLRPASAGKPALEGWNMPGRNFRAGDGWWGLACGKATDCRLVPLRLTITPARHEVYDSAPVPSQWLVWSPLPSTGNLHAVFKPVRSLAGLPLTAGPVKTWLQRGMEGPYPDPGRIATMEVAIPLGSGTTALLVPRLRAAVKQGNGNDQPESLVLELRVGRQRQLLDQFDDGGAEPLTPVDPKDYLVWAGDLDGDGRLDLLLNTGGCSRKLALWLSSRAQGPAMVGLAGSFEYFDPGRSEC